MSQVAGQVWTERLQRRWADGRMLCVGLDPVWDRLPVALRGSAHVEESIYRFNQAIIDATAEFACAFKPNIAYYEALGSEGLSALSRTVAYVHAQYPELIVLLDAKRGDIASTNEAYAVAMFDVLGADAVTVSPYLGAEALEPILARADRGVFVLVKTSNPGAGEFQDIQIGPNEPLYEGVARRVATAWNSRENCGVVVGATYPAEIGRVREIIGDMPMLIPGVGAQGGTLGDVLGVGLDSTGGGVLINVSRRVIYASTDEDYAVAAAGEAGQLADEILLARHG
jgi:orotidine-5'-phosphate decarboxylase